jgi:hypothetical protein
LTSLVAIEDPASGDQRYRAVWITSDAADSVVDLSSLSMFRDNWASVDDGDGRRSRITISNGAAVRLSQSGMSQLQGVAVSLAGAITGGLELLSNGRLTGAGSIAGNLRNGGSITIGAGMTITVGGNFVAAAGSVLAFDIAGASEAQRGRLRITGTATFGGTFRAIFVNGYVPAAGVSFADLLTFSSFSGAFSLIDATGLSGGRSLIGRYNPSNFALEIA